MIRPATLEEIHVRGDLIAAAALETQVRGEPNWRALYAMKEVGCLLLLGVEVDGRLVGFACCVLSPEFFGEAVSCSTVSIFVMPPHGHRWWRPLLLAIAEACVERGAELLRIRVLAGSRLQLHLERCGFPPTSCEVEIVPTTFLRQYGRHGAGSHRDRGARVPGLRG